MRSSLSNVYIDVISSNQKDPKQQSRYKC